MVGSFPLTRFMASVITLWQPAAQLPGLSASCTPLALAGALFCPSQRQPSIPVGPAKPALQCAVIARRVWLAA